MFLTACNKLFKDTGKSAVVVPTGFITSKKRNNVVAYNILQKIVDEHIVCGCTLKKCDNMCLSLVNSYKNHREVFSFLHFSMI